MIYLERKRACRQGAADHVDVGSRGGALFLRERATGRGKRFDIVEGMRRGMSIMRTEKEKKEIQNQYRLKVKCVAACSNEIQ